MAPSMTHVMGHHAMGSVSSAGMFESQPIIVTDGSAMPINDAAHRPDGLAKTIDAYTLTAQPARLALHYFIRACATRLHLHQTDQSSEVLKPIFRAWRGNRHFGAKMARRIVEEFQSGPILPFLVSVRPSVPGATAPNMHPLQDEMGRVARFAHLDVLMFEH